MNYTSNYLHNSCYNKKIRVHCCENDALLRNIHIRRVHSFHQQHIHLHNTLLLRFLSQKSHLQILLYPENYHWYYQLYHFY